MLQLDSSNFHSVPKFSDMRLLTIFQLDNHHTQPIITSKHSQQCSQPKFWMRLNSLTLSKQQYFVWDTASQSTKLQDMLEIWRGMAPVAPPGHAY